MMVAICIATGPSLTENDVKTAVSTDAAVYVVNDAYKLVPNANVLYAADVDWWNYHEGVVEFNGEKWTCDYTTSIKWNLNYIKGESNILFGEEEPIAYGGNSGFQAINLAYLHGHKEIILLGYDLGHDENESKHYFGEHPRKINRYSNYKKWIEHYRKAKPVMDKLGITIKNATRRTKLDMFERITL